MAKSVIGADRNHVIVADLDDLAALAKRVAALEALARSLEDTPQPDSAAAGDTGDNN